MLISLYKHDDALAETIDGLYTPKEIHRCGQGETEQAGELTILQWVSRFNHHRLMGPQGYLPPAEFEVNCHRQRAG